MGEPNTERNKRVQARYDQLMAEGKHGHYETMFRVVREEVERTAANDLFEALKDYRQRFYSAVITTGSADAEIATLACAKADAALAKALGGK